MNRTAYRERRCEVVDAIAAETVSATYVVSWVRRCVYTLVVSVAALLFSGSCSSGIFPATTAKPPEYERLCFTDSTVRLELIRTPLRTRTRKDRSLPQIQPDLICKIVEELSIASTDPRLRAVLVGPVNDAVNTRLEAINGGRYNAIYLRISPTTFVGITPVIRTSWLASSAASRPDALMVWRPPSVTTRVLLAALDVGGLRADNVWLFSGAGERLSVATSVAQISRRRARGALFRDWIVYPVKLRRVQNCTPASDAAPPVPENDR